MSMAAIEPAGTPNSSRGSLHGARRVMRTGDGFYVSFETADDAIGCAVAIQRCFDEHRREQGFAPPIGIGLHGTRATPQGSDWRGVGVHIAAIDWRQH
jgi:class 3 adenylate cyclase